MTADAAPATHARTLWLCFAVAVLEGYDLQVVSIAGPMLRTAMQLDPRSSGVIFSASLIGLAVGAAFGGVLADRIGRKQVLVYSVAGMALTTLVTALAHDFQTVLIIRILTGITLGSALPNLIAIAATVSGKGRTTTQVTAMICGLPVGGILSALGGHALAATFGWHSLFIFGGAVTLVIIPLLIWGLRDTKPHQHRTEASASWRQSLFGTDRAAMTLLLWLLFILTLAIFSAFAGWAPTLIVDKGLPASAGFSAMIAINIGGIAGALIFSAMCDRLGVRSAMLVIYGGMALSLWLFSSSDTAGAVIPLAGVVGFFVLGAQFTLYGISPQLYPAVHYGAGVGSAVAAGRVGSILGPIVAGYVMSLGASANDLVLGMVPIAIAAGAVLIGLAAVSGGILRRKRVVP